MKTTELQFLRRVGLAALMAAVILCSWLAPLDRAADHQVDAGLKRALVSFATARALNAVISVAQGTEVAFEPAGIGMVFTPGQLLDPLNDLVEQFSNLMLAASVAFGIQKVFLSIGAHWLASSLLTVLALGWGAFYLRPKPVPAVLSRLLIVLLMIRFAVPVVAIGTDMLFREFMAADYQSSQQAIDMTSGQINRLSPPVSTTSDAQGAFEKFKGWWSQNADVKAHFENLKQATEQSAEHVVKLMAIFLLQTLVIPLLLLWGLYGIARGALRWPVEK
jgi:hypothetical protein